MAPGAPLPADDRALSIAEVASAFGLPISTLRYYDKIELVPASHRRSRVRCYDRVALRRLMYVQLCHIDAALSIEQTHAILSSRDRTQRNEVIDRRQQELAHRIARLTEAHDLLSHMNSCQYDDTLACPVTSDYLTQQLDAGLERWSGTAN